MANTKPKRDYEIGRGKSPTHTQFVKGQGGNRNGRPKGSKNMKTLFEKEGHCRVELTENGAARKLSKNELLAKAVYNRGIKGDIRSYMLLRRLLNFNEASEQPDADSETDLLDITDEQVLANWVARNKKDDAK